MNLPMLRYVLGRMTTVFTFLLLAPLLVALIYGEGMAVIGSYLASIALAAGLSFLLSFRRPKNLHLYMKEGLVICSLSWLLFSFLGCLPFVFSGDIPQFVDAFFETVSGFTTTGSSILNNIESLSRANLFWRSFTHLVGGMGVLVFGLAVLPKTSSDSVHIMRAEVPGPAFGKLVARLRSTARILYAIYLAMTAILIILLMLGGLNLFDAMIHAFGAAGTGGFSNYTASVGHFHNDYVKMLLAGAMILFGINFNLYYLVLMRQAKKALSSEELRWYLGIFGGAVLLCFISCLPFYHQQLWPSFRDVFFTVASIMSTTGYAVTDFNHWPLFSRGILLLLMFIGSCAGSTAGGLKVSRVVVLMKQSRLSIRKSREPRRKLIANFEGRQLEENYLSCVSTYFQIYILIFVVSVLLVCIEAPSFITAFSSVAATLNNIGPGLDVVGPSGNFAFFSPLNKLILSFDMLAGRLELFPMLILFMPSTWKRMN